MDHMADTVDLYTEVWAAPVDMEAPFTVDTGFTEEVTDITEVTDEGSRDIVAMDDLCTADSVATEASAYTAEIMDLEMAYLVSMRQILKT